MFYKDIIEFGDRKFLLYRTVREFNKLDTNILKQYWHCDTVLKKENTKRGRGKLCEIKLSLPGPTIFASSNEDRFEVSIAETIRDLEIQLKKRKGLFHPY